MKFTAILALLMILVAQDILAAGLQITEIDVHADYDEAYTYRVENRDRKNSASVPVANNTKIDVDVLPGSNVTFTIRVENNFKGEDPKLRGVFTTITIEDIDDGADLEEESTDFDLEPGDDYRFDVIFAIPLDVDAGTYNTIIEAEGEDRNDTSYKTEVKLKLEVKKQSHDIRITKFLLNPSVIDCDRKTKLVAEITNAGSNPENQVALEFKSGNLGINSFDRDISLESSEEASDEEKTHTKSLNIEVPSFLRAGAYPIFINLYWKNFVLFDQKIAELIVKDCAASATKTVKQQEPKQETEKKTETVTVIQPKVEQKETIITTEEISILNNPLLISIVLGSFVIVVLAALIAVGYLKKSKIQ